VTTPAPTLLLVLATRKAYTSDGYLAMMLPSYARRAGCVPVGIDRTLDWTPEEAAVLAAAVGRSQGALWVVVASNGTIPKEIAPAYRAYVDAFTVSAVRSPVLDHDIVRMTAARWTEIVRADFARLVQVVPVDGDGDGPH
jgi:hypothetical protein